MATFKHRVQDHGRFRRSLCDVVRLSPAVLADEHPEDYGHEGLGEHLWSIWQNENGDLIGSFSFWLHSPEGMRGDWRPVWAY